MNFNESVRTATPLDVVSDEGDSGSLRAVTATTTIATGGAYGITDYEIRVPSGLASYKGSTDTVTFYYELQ